MGAPDTPQPPSSLRRLSLHATWNRKTRESNVSRTSSPARCSWEKERIAPPWEEVKRRRDRRPGDRVCLVDEAGRPAACFVPCSMLLFGRVSTLGKTCPEMRRRMFRARANAIFASSREKGARRRHGVHLLHSPHSIGHALPRKRCGCGRTPQHDDDKAEERPPPPSSQRIRSWSGTPAPSHFVARASRKRPDVKHPRSPPVSIAILPCICTHAMSLGGTAQGMGRRRLGMARMVSYLYRMDCTERTVLYSTVQYSTYIYGACCSIGFGFGSTCQTLAACQQQQREPLETTSGTLGKLAPCIERQTLWRHEWRGDRTCLRTGGERRGGECVCISVYAFYPRPTPYADAYLGWAHGQAHPGKGSGANEAVAHRRTHSSEQACPFGLA